MIDCSKCHGYCCRKAGLLDPNLDRGDGCCKYLNKDNKCDIYDHRPLICNTDRMYVLFFNNMSREEYDKLNNEACIKLRNEYEETNKEEIHKEE